MIDYWNRRYRSGGRSGQRKLPDRKLEERYRNRGRLISRFALRNQVSTVLDIGSGDGRQAAYLDVPGYLGVDPSIEAVRLARKQNPAKTFELLEDPEPRDMHLSLEVMFHLIDDDTYRQHLDLLFSADRFVVVWASDHDETGAAHVRHRHWTPDVEGWRLTASPEVAPHLLTFWERT